MYSKFCRTTLLGFGIWALSAAGSMGQIDLSQGSNFSTGFETSEGFSDGYLISDPAWYVFGLPYPLVGNFGVDGTKGIELGANTTLSIDFDGDEEPTIGWVDFQVKPSFSGADSLPTDSIAGQAAVTGFAFSDGSAEVFVLDGNDGLGDAFWLGSGHTVSVEEEVATATDYLRLTYRLDYADNLWDLYVNGELKKADIGFFEVPSGGLSSFRIDGSVHGDGYFDQFEAGYRNPIFEDNDNDGIADSYENQEQMDPTVNDRSGDHDFDGVSNLLEYMTGLKAGHPDSDDDGKSDGAELASGSDPTLHGGYSLHPVPYSEDFENLSSGTLSGQGLWEVSGGYSKVQSEETYSGTQALQVGRENVETSIRLATHFDGSDESVVWIDTFIKPVVFTETDSVGAWGENPASLFFFSSDGTVRAFDGNGDGSGTWKSFTYSPSNDWQHLAVRQDYSSQLFDLWINGEQIASKIGFAHTQPYLSEFAINQDSSDYSVIDNLSIGSQQPENLGGGGGTNSGYSLWTGEVLTELEQRMPQESEDPVVLIDSDYTGWSDPWSEMARSEVVEVDDPEQPFDFAKRVTNLKSFYDKPYRVVTHSPYIQEDLASGRVILVTVWIRSLVLQGGDSGTVRLFLAKGNPYDEVGQAGATLDSNWRKLYIVGFTEKAYAAGTVRLAAHLGFDDQIVELGPISILDVGAVGEVDLDLLPKNEVTWPGKSPDAAWRQEAQNRIESIRQRDLRLTILDDSGNPVSNSEVELSQLKRTCSIGSFTGSKMFKESESDLIQLKDKYARLFDRITIPIYWADWGWLSKEDDYMEIARWARDQPADVRGHVVIYPGLQYMPTYMRDLAAEFHAAPEGSPERLAAKEQFQAECIAQIWWLADKLEEASDAANGKIFKLDELDVTNELRHLNSVSDIVGSEGVLEWFVEARKAFPGVKLCLNENTILNNNGNTEAEQDDLLWWYNYLRDNGQAPEVLGFQGHFSEAVTGPEKMWQILDRFAAETDAEIQITEFDVNTLNDQAQADYTRDFLTAMFAHPAVTGVTMWGFWEGDHWLPNAANWRIDWTARPSADIYEELLGQRWRTDLVATTDENGQLFASDVFTGELKAVVSTPGGDTYRVTFPVDPGEGEASQTIQLPGNPNTELGDADFDGLSDAEEMSLGTEPYDPDSDDDGVSDGAEVASGANPLSMDSYDLRTLPFEEDFESYNIGSIQGQGFWSVTGGYSRVQEEETIVDSSQALRLGKSDTPTDIRLTNRLDGSDHSVVWIDTYLKPIRGETVDPALASEDAAAIIQFGQFDTVKVYDGNGDGSGTWLTFQHPVSGSGWEHLAVRQDYAAQNFDLWVNGEQVAAGLGFAHSQPFLNRFTIRQTSEDSVSFVDDLTIGSDRPGDLVGGEGPSQPNVLFIVVDDLRQETGSYGGQALTPNMDRLAEESVIFDRAYCNVPVCGASRASFLTGIRPGVHRFVSFKARADEDAPNALTLPQAFKDSGYTTASIGKIFHYMVDSKEGWDSRIDPQRDGASWRDYLVDENIALEEGAGNGPAYEKYYGDEKYRDERSADEAIETLTMLAEDYNTTGKPFFLATGFRKPHLPFNAPDEFWDLYDFDSITLPPNDERYPGIPGWAYHQLGELKTYSGVPGQPDNVPQILPDEYSRTLIHGYYAATSFVDAQIGRVIDQLDALGLRENTIIVLLGDHGYYLGEHTLWAKHRNFVDALEIPFMVDAPGTAGGQRSQAMVELVDLFPTLLDLAGIDPPIDQLEGQSLKENLENPSSSGDDFIISKFKDGVSLITSRYSYTEWINVDESNNVTVKAQTLFDLESDPLETQNLADDAASADLVNQLQAQLRANWGSRFFDEVPTD